MSIKEIMDEISPLWGVCPFDKIKEGLIDCRAKNRLPENPQSVIVACFPYLLEKENYENINISKYAVVTDYHTVAINRLNGAAEKLKKLYPDEEFVTFADNSPVPEVSAACAAGLGSKGLHTLLITEKYGSYVFIGEIVTSLGIECDDVPDKNCIGCKRCIERCPSGALTGNGFDRALCLSEITQKKGILTEEEAKLMKECGCVWGCDICQDICPMNKNAATTPIEEFIFSPIPFVDEGCTLENRAYEWRGRKTIERNISLHKR
ncbi:MAG: epoxyqueuosine reductase [Ruminococcaceae bacterium]|nr:epoxyqueuosine reductase [Oscillospiraceae bacterium]